MKKCLICEKELREVDYGTGVGDGGTLRAEFSYGSRLDCGGSTFWNARNKPEAPRIERLGGANEIMAYICDECFLAKAHLFEGFYYRTQKTEEGFGKRSYVECRDGSHQELFLCDRVLEVPQESQPGNKLKRIVRDRRLTPEEVARDKETRRKIQEEFPPAKPSSQTDN